MESAAAVTAATVSATTMTAATATGHDRNSREDRREERAGSQAQEV